MNFSIVAGMHSSNRAIGSCNNSIPWKCKEDMRFFRDLTMRTENPEKVNAVIMGYNTWTSLGCKALPNRLNVVLSRKIAWMERSIPENVMVCSSLDEALYTLSTNTYVESAFVIGGGNVYEQAIRHSSCVKIYLNKVHAPLLPGYTCNVFFPHIDYNMYELLETSEGEDCTKCVFIRSSNKY